MHWQAVSISQVPPPAYRLVDIMKLAGKSDGHISQGLGRTLQSDHVGRDEKLAAVEISKLGGVVNHNTTEASLDRVVNVMLGSDWKGGDKALIENAPAFKRLPGLETLLVSEYSGVSHGAIARFQAEMPKATVRTFVWEFGKKDRDFSDLAMSEEAVKYARRYARRFPKDPVFAIGKDDARKSWPFIHPGPFDGWAGGNRKYNFTVTFDMGRIRRKFYTLNINLVSSHGDGPPLLQVDVNGTSWNIRLAKGPRDQDVMTNPMRGRPQTHMVTMRSSILKPAGNRLTITTVNGSWFLYDSLQFVSSDEAPSATGVRASLPPRRYRPNKDPLRVIVLDFTGGVLSESASAEIKFLGKRYVCRIEPAGRLLRTVDLLVPLDNPARPAAATITIKAGKKTFRTEVTINRW